MLQLACKMSPSIICSWIEIVGAFLSGSKNMVKYENKCYFKINSCVEIIYYRNDRCKFELSIVGSSLHYIHHSFAMVQSKCAVFKISYCKSNVEVKLQI